MEASNREGWGTRAGFILAAVGSAVGLGNMWRFPYVTAESGGAAFVFFYILMVFLIGIPVMLAEFSVGRRTQLSPIGAMRKAGGSAWTPLGYLFVATGFLILSYYSVIAGWTMRYTLGAALGGFSTNPAEYFGATASGTGALLYHLAFMGITIAVVAGGIKTGIERASLVLMPILFLLIIGLAVWAMFLDGAQAGYSFYLRPDPQRLLSLQTLGDASGQAFFSLSLGMGAMLTYSSYLSRQEDLPSAGVTIAASDFAVAFFAGLVVFPVIFALGLREEIGASTIGALFISLPRAFVQMPGGQFIGLLFFGALFIGALTSGISLLEVVTSSLIDNWRIPRTSAALGAGLVIMAIGIPSAYSTDFLGLVDQLAGNFFLIAGAFALTIFVGWRMDNPLTELQQGFRMEGLLKGWYWTVRFVVPIVLALVLYQVGRDTIAAIF